MKILTWEQFDARSIFHPSIRLFGNVYLMTKYSRWYISEHPLYWFVNEIVYVKGVK